VEFLFEEVRCSSPSFLSDKAHILYDESHGGCKRHVGFKPDGSREYADDFDAIF